MVADPTEVTECRWVAVDETKAIAYEELEPCWSRCDTLCGRRPYDACCTTPQHYLFRYLFY
jgi:hypothetical protein